MGDPEVESPPDDRATGLERPVVPEVVPEAERDRGELQAAPAAPPVLHPPVTVVGGGVHHTVRSQKHSFGGTRDVQT